MNLREVNVMSVRERDQSNQGIIPETRDCFHVVLHLMFLWYMLG